MTSVALDFPHRRRNALNGDWILVSPHRTKRPWQGKIETVNANQRPAYDPVCYLCPGNVRAAGLQNPPYSSTYVFPNDFAALLPETQPDIVPGHELLHAENVSGESRVICFSPRHDLTLPEMSAEELLAVVNIWASQMEELGAKWKWVQLFENKGDIMGCSNPHPHGQIWASDALPNEAAKENREQKLFFDQNGVTLLSEYLQQETKSGERIVVENEHWVVVIPYWGVWPYETLLIPRRAVQRIDLLSPEERVALADILKRHLTRYDNLFNISFPYSMGWHGAPTGPKAQDEPHWHLHAHFYPPLLRSATVKKFMVGYEMFGEAQRDLTAEQAAEKLRGLSEVHYKSQG